MEMDVFLPVGIVPWVWGGLRRKGRRGRSVSSEHQTSSASLSVSSPGP